MIIDATYFEKGSLYIPNNKDISAAPLSEGSAMSEIEFFIDKYERELLLNALGVTLYNLLVTAMDDLPSADQKWQDLVNGKDYTINSKTHRWEGLKGYNKQSLIAFYVYCQYLRNDESTYTTTGVVQNTAKNAENYNPTGKYINAWSSFMCQYQKDNYYNEPRVIYNGSGEMGLDYFNNNDVQRSLYQYLTDANELDPTAFPDFEFRFYNIKTSLGI